MSAGTPREPTDEEIAFLAIDTQMAIITASLCDAELDDEMKDLVHAVARAAYLRGAYDCALDRGEFLLKITRVLRVPGL